MQLMLLEQQNKKRLMMARLEQDTSVAEGPRGKSSFSNVDDHPKPQMEEDDDEQPSRRPANRLTGAGIVPAVARDM